MNNIGKNHKKILKIKKAKLKSFFETVETGTDQRRLWKYITKFILASWIRSWNRERILVKKTNTI